MRKPLEDKALAWWCELNNLIPQMSVRPTYRFMNRDTKEISQRNIDQLVRDYKKSRESDKQKGKQNGDR